MKETKINFNKVLRKLSEIERKLDDQSQSRLEDYISEYDARKHFKKGTTWFWNLRKNGLPFIKLGNEVYYKKNDLIEFLESNKQGGNEHKV